MKKTKEKEHTLESSIKFLAELSTGHSQNYNNKTIRNGTMITSHHTGDSHPFFDWDSWTFIDKKVYNK